MKHEIPHNHPPDQLEKAVRRFSDVYCERFREYDARAVWTDASTLEVRFKVKGVGLSGALHLRPETLAIEMTVPMAFRLFKGRALRAIEEEVRPWLEAAARGELP